MKEEAKEIELDIEVGKDCIERAIACTAWSWKRGSRLFFWCWGEFTEEARDRAKIFVQDELPNCKLKQRKLEQVRIVRGNSETVDLGDKYY